METISGGALPSVPPFLLKGTMKTILVVAGRILAIIGICAIIGFLCYSTYLYIFHNPMPPPSPMDCVGFWKS